MSKCLTNKKAAAKLQEYLQGKVDVYEIAEELSEAYYHMNSLKKAAEELDMLLVDLHDWECKADKWMRDNYDYDFLDKYQYILRALIDVEEDPKGIEADDYHAFSRLDKPSFVYFILNEEKDKVKIGVSNTPQLRVKELQTASGEDLSLLHSIEFKTRREAFNAEDFLHKVFEHWRKKPKCFAGKSEWFDARIIDTLMNQYDTREKIAYLAKQRSCFEAKQDHEACKVLEKLFLKKEETA